MKRIMDVLVAGAGLIFTAPLFLMAAIAVKFDSKGPIFFCQERIGRHCRPFRILKFRSMVVEAPKQGGLLTAGGDPRITRVGRILRQAKLDELPQLINVLRGDMSLVGPRPEVRRYVDLFPREFETILSVRPGITDWASIRYRHESALLARADNPEAEYVRVILPDKLRLARQYVAHQSTLVDLKIIAQTLATVLTNRTMPDNPHPERASAPGMVERA